MPSHVVILMRGKVAHADNQPPGLVGEAFANRLGTLASAPPMRIKPISAAHYA